VKQELKVYAQQENIARWEQALVRQPLIAQPDSIAQKELNIKFLAQVEPFLLPERLSAQPQAPESILLDNQQSRLYVEEAFTAQPELMEQITSNARSILM